MKQSKRLQVAQLCRHELDFPDHQQLASHSRSDFIFYGLIISVIGAQLTPETIVIDSISKCGRITLGGLPSVDDQTAWGMMTARIITFPERHSIMQLWKIVLKERQTE